MTLSKLKTMKKDRGFTIVELLIVIVVIAILAAIVIVAYSGIQNRAKSSSAKSTAQAVQSKAEAYNADGPTGAYPVLLANMTSAATTTSYYLSGVTFSAADPTSAAATNVVSFYTCTGGGNKIGYYDYAGGAVAYVYTGPASSASTCALTAS
jgi:prepilin-type N-terminal cleavage/methylation domain-containing protein